MTPAQTRRLARRLREVREGLEATARSTTTVKILYVTDQDDNVLKTLRITGRQAQRHQSGYYPLHYSREQKKRWLPLLPRRPLP